jgi:hypothetical protein
MTSERRKIMDYKSVIEEQIKKLQEVQETVIKNTDVHMAPDSCTIAETIARLCDQARYMPSKENGSAETNPQIRHMPGNPNQRFLYPNETTSLEETDSLNQDQDCSEVARSYKGFEVSKSEPVEQY